MLMRQTLRAGVVTALCLGIVGALAGAARADETCNSPYVTKLIKGQEDYVYVWALGVEGLGDGSDKLVTVDANPKSTDGGSDGYGYDLAVNPKKNVLLTSSFDGFNNYMRPPGELVNGAEAMKRFGNTMVVWDLKAMKARTVLSVPGAPLEIRWSLAPGDNWAVAATALTSKIWLVKQDASGQWQAQVVANIGDPAKIPLPVDISITRDGNVLWVSTFMYVTTRYFARIKP